MACGLRVHEVGDSVLVSGLGFKVYGLGSKGVDTIEAAIL